MSQTRNVQKLPRLRGHMKYLMPRAGELAQVNSARAIVDDHVCTVISLLKSQATANKVSPR